MRDENLNLGGAVKSIRALAEKRNATLERVCGEILGRVPLGARALIASSDARGLRRRARAYLERKDRQAAAGMGGYVYEARSWRPFVWGSRGRHNASPLG